MDPKIKRVSGSAETRDGWRLPWCRFEPPGGAAAGTRPVVLVPGYAMNSFILGYHPTGPGLAEHLAARGLETWTVDLRGQGDSCQLEGRAPFDMSDLALTDLPTMIDAILEESATGAETVDIIGCSLGATYMFMYATWAPNARAARLVNLGGPLRWTGIHPAFRAAFGLAPIWSRLPLKGTRGMARRALPLLLKMPKLLHVYLHPAITDLSEPQELTRTIDDPIPAINRQIGRWVQHGDLIHGGRNLTEESSALTLPLLTVLANADGVVPESTACSAHNAMTGARRLLIRAGDHRTPMAHADLFISEHATKEVFEPMAEWLLEG